MFTKEPIRPNFKCYDKARLSWLLLNIRLPSQTLMLQKFVNRPKLFNQPLLVDELKASRLLSKWTKANRT